jgi:hypothetical protein
MGQISRIIISTDTSSTEATPYEAFFDDEATLQARPVVPLDSIAPPNSIAPLDSVSPRRKGRSPWLLGPVVLGASLTGAVIGAAGIRLYTDRSVPSTAQAPASSVSAGISTGVSTLADARPTPGPSEQVTKPVFSPGPSQSSRDLEASAPRIAPPLGVAEPDRRATGSGATPNSKESAALPAEYSPRPDPPAKRDVRVRSTEKKTVNGVKDDPPPVKKEETRPRRVHDERSPQSISRIREIFEDRQP